ncbi:MAG: hypothetical protein E7047_07385 [Lentisphaerae bacterium]|nr:hypothetical protein [Lentisphaerota bacterium]
MKIYSLSADWQFADAALNNFRAIDVPGDVNHALFKYGDLPDPHIGVQFREYFPNSSKAWTYRKCFDKPEFEENAELIFEGITGAAEIFLNNEKLGEARNAHRPHRFEVGSKLLDKNNVLEVRIEAIEKTLGQPRRDAFGWGNERTFLRTPPFNYGWDWSVAVPSIGLSGQVKLECDNALKLVNVNYRTPELGRVDFFIESSRLARKLGYEIRLRVWGHGADIKETLSSNLNMISLAMVEEKDQFSQHRVFTTLFVPNAKYWQSNGTGEAALYNYSVELVVNGEVADSFTGRLGFRTVRVVEKPFRKESGPGFSYEIELNGQRVFVRGGNWIPVELWPAVATEAQYRRLLSEAKNANFNMIRVWGGGIYEPELFYDLCDEYGIMVWQDFMFASNAYPLGVLREEIKLEAEYQLKRLRLHPCICHWCGINEDVFSWAYPGCGRLANMVQADFGDYTGSGIWQFHDDPELYGMLLRGMTSQMGNDVPYIESSPHSHGDCGNLPQSGTCHFTSSFYLRQNPQQFRDHFSVICSFDSEFAHQGPDTAYRTKEFLGLSDPVAWPPENEALWEAHINRGHGEALWKRQTDVAQKIIGPINSFEDFIKNVQVSHLELVRCEYEHFRANRPDCGGTMIWMYNDCWPTGSWSLINYYGERKPAYYMAKRYCATQIPVVIALKGEVRFGFDNCNFEARNIKYTYGLTSLSGQIKWVRSGETVAAANAFTLLDVCALDKDERESGDHYFISVESFDIARCFPGTWLGIEWPETEGIIEDVAPGQVRVTATRGYMRMAHLASKEPHKIIDFSDNFFDLAEGESRVIATTAKAADLRLLHWNSADWE